MEFFNSLELCNPAKKSLLPLADTLASFILKEFLNGKEALKSVFKKLTSKISLTCNGWTSPGNNSVLGITAHWIQNQKLKWVILAVIIINGTHSGANLASHLAEVLEIFGITQKIFCITADNASNNITMGQELNSLIDFDNVNCMLGCMPHVINLAAKAGIKAFSEATPQENPRSSLHDIPIDSPPQVNMNTHISWISKFTTCLKQSTQKADEFAHLSSVLNRKELVMVADVSTR
jgi:hypothetical protein